MNINNPVIDAFTPMGRLRASINLGNPILANRDAVTGEVTGVQSILRVRLRKGCR